MAEFEGDEVSDFTAQIPSMTLETDQAYPRGTYLTLQVEVRVRSIRIDEDRKGNLSRKHVLAIEDVKILERLTPEQRRAFLAQATAAVEDGAPVELTFDDADADAFDDADVVVINDEAQAFV